MTSKEFAELERLHRYARSNLLFKLNVGYGKSVSLSTADEVQQPLEPSSTAGQLRDTPSLGVTLIASQIILS